MTAPRNLLVFVVIAFVVGFPSEGLRESWPERPGDVCTARLFGEPEEHRRAGTQGLAVVVRVLDECELDRQVVLSQVGDREPRIDARTSVKASIAQQLKVIEGDQPSIGFDDACSSVEIRRPREERQIDTAKLKSMIDDFRSIEIRPTVESPFVIHGTSYEVWVYSGANQSYFSFFGVQGSEECQNPLERWVDRLLALAGLTCDPE